MRKRATSPGGSADGPSDSSSLFGCCYWTLRDLVLNGHIPAVRIPSPRARDGRVVRLILIDSRLKIREGDMAHDLPVNPRLNRIRFHEADDARFELVPPSDRERACLAEAA